MHDDRATIHRYVFVLNSSLPSSPSYAKEMTSAHALRLEPKFLVTYSVHLLSRAAEATQRQSLQPCNDG
jgi:hypothetical protein